MTFVAAFEGAIVATGVWKGDGADGTAAFEGAIVATGAWHGDGVGGVARRVATIPTDEAPADEALVDNEPGDSNRELGESIDCGVCPTASS